MSTNWTRPVTIFDGEDEAQLKERFAKVRAQFSSMEINDFQVAMKVFEGLPEFAMRAGQAALTWGRDPDVLERVKELRRVGFVEEESVDKATLTREVLALGRDQQAPLKERLQAYDLVAKINGMIDRPGANVNVAVVNRVMRVKDHGEDDEWEARVAEQQTRLMSDAASTH